MPTSKILLVVIESMNEDLQPWNQPPRDDFGELNEWYQSVSRAMIEVWHEVQRIVRLCWIEERSKV